MKTSITTIALFSLVFVATSFTTPKTTNSKSEIIPPIDGGVSSGGGRKQDGYTAAFLSTNNFRLPIDGGVSSGGGRKQDGFRADNQSTISLGGFNADRQSAGNSRKID
jgi:hypothetical protein